MKIQDIIGQEVNISITNTDYKVIGILHDVDVGGILIEVLSMFERGVKTTKSNISQPFPYNIGDIAYIKDRGFHLTKTKQIVRNDKLNQLL